MYVPRHFEETRVDVLQALIRAYPFGTMITMTAGGLEASHIPLVLADTPAPLGTLRGHLARANPLWREFDAEAEALVLFQGPHAYISPSWYPSKQETGKAVPTWNYVLVHAYGRLQICEDAVWLRAHLEELTDQHEAGRSAPWRLADAPAEYTDKLLSGIVGIEIRISRLIGQWKLSQNRTAADRAGVLRGLQQEQTPQAAAMAKLMGGMDGSSMAEESKD